MTNPDPFAAFALKHRREKWRRDWIMRFRERQHIARKWIEFRELAEWCAQSSAATSACRERQAFDRACQRFAESILQGEFETASRSKILYLDPKVFGIGQAPHRLTREWFAAACRGSAQFDQHFRLDAAEGAFSLPMNVLAHCWLPADRARGWLQAHGYRLAPYLDPAPVPSVARVAARRGRARVRQTHKSRPFWREGDREIDRWLEDNGCPAPNDGNQAELERHVATWLDGRGHQASESTIRRHVQQGIEKFRARIGAEGHQDHEMNQRAKIDAGSSGSH